MPEARCELIPRHVLFGNPSRMAPRISPDGSSIGWIEPRDGVLNIWIAPVGDLGAARPLTTSKRPLYAFNWAYDDRHILYTDDIDGNENRRLWAIAIDTGVARMLTPERGVAAAGLRLSPDRPGTVGIGLNDRDPAMHDLWLIDIESGARERVFENVDGYNSQYCDWDLSLRLLRRENRETGGSTLVRLTAGHTETLFDVSHEDDVGTDVLGFERDGRHVLLASSAGRDTNALFRLDITTGAQTLLAAHERSDLASMVRDAATGRVLAVSFDYQRREWTAIDPAVAEDLRFLADAAGELDFNPYSLTQDGAHWVVIFYGPTQPGRYSLYDRRHRTLTPLFDLRPTLADYGFVPMHPVIIPARDGLKLVSYLTLPRTADGARPSAPLPMVLIVHGGPWSRDQYGCNTQHQWLADRGYAVLSVNYRGSIGFGKSFVNAGDRQHAGAMHDDLVDAVDWAVREGIALRDKVAITGASYGGYAALLGLTFTPEVFCCAVSLVGISNLVTLLETIPPYWHTMQNLFYRRYADPRTEEGRAWLWERSPLSRVDRITKPLLLGHGQNDVRCKVAESEQIVTAMRERGLTVRFLVYADEGHGFARPENALSFAAMQEAFFAEHLGGRCEPVGDDLAGSSMVEA